jgi:hypothetical protein
MVLLLLLLALLLVAPIAASLQAEDIAAETAAATRCVIRPGSLPIDTQGNAVHAHGAGVFSEGNDYYLLGTSEKQAVPSNSSDPTSPVVYLSASINLYSSLQQQHGGLCDWNFLGAVVNRSTVEWAMRPVLSAGETARLERPKLVKTTSGSYVIYAHVQASHNASYSNVAVLRAAAVGGPYIWASNFFANGIISKDSTVFRDPIDNRSFFVRDTAHLCDSISELTPDGMGVLPMCSHTGPAVARGYYQSMCRGKYAGPGNGSASHPPWVCEGVCMFRDPVDHRLVRTVLTAPCCRKYTLIHCTAVAKPLTQRVHIHIISICGLRS